MSRNTLALLGLIAASVFSAGASAADPQAVRYYEDAVTRFNSGELKGAEIQLKNSLTRDPGQLSARILMGRVQLGLGDAEQAEEALETANKLGADTSVTALPLARARNQLGKQQLIIDSLVPTDFSIDQQPDLWVELGLARLYAKDLDGAEIAFEEALKRRPGHVGARVGLAKVPMEGQDFLAAGGMADEILETAPQNAEAWFIKGSAMHAQGRFQDAAAAYARAHELDPGRLQAALGEASALMDGNKPAKAAALLRNLQPANPYSAVIPYLLSQALERIDRRDEAKKALADAAAIVAAYTPTDIADRPADLLLFGLITFRDGKLEQASSFLETYVNAGGSDIMGRKMLARTLIALGRPGDALRVLARVKANQLADAETLTLLGDANIEMGDFEAAQRNYAEALRDYRGGPAIARRLAIAQYKGGQRAQGVSTLEELNALLPQGAETGNELLLGFLYLAEGRAAEAEAIANRVMAGSQRDADSRNLLATALLVQGRRKAAREVFQQLAADIPDYYPARINLIRLDIADGDYAKASGTLSRMLAEDGEDIQALFESARLARSQGDTRGAIVQLQKVRGQRPASVEAAKALVDAYLAEGDKADAMATANALDAAAPNNFDAHKLLAEAMVANDDPAGARIALQKASLLAGNDTRRLYDTGTRQMRLGAFEDAAWTFTKIMALDPAAVDARFDLATSLFRQNKIAEAEREIGLLKDQHPDLALADALLADIRLAQGRPGEAIRLYRAALQGIERTEVVSSLYRALRNNDQEAEAVQLLEDWLNTHPDSLPALNLLGEYHLSRGDSDAAQSIYRRLAELDPGNAQVLNNLSISLRDFDSEQALKAALAAYELSPDNPFVLDTLGWSLVQIGNLDKGLGHLREARARYGRSPTIRYHLGVALQEYGSHGAALQELREALKLGGDFPDRANAEVRVSRLEAMTR